MTEICDPFGGWSGIGHVWAHCRGMEDACVEVELLGISSTHALVKIIPSWTSSKTAEIAPGSYEEYNENGTVWRVYCNGVSLSQMLAKIEICYEEAVTVPCSDHETQTACEGHGCYWYGGACHSEPENGVPCSDHTTQTECEAAGCYWCNGVCQDYPCGEGYELPLYGSVTVLGHKFTNTRLMCETSQAIIRPEGLAAKTLVVGGTALWAVSTIVLPGSILPSSVIMGGIYVKLKEIDDACTKATIEIFEDVYTEEDHDKVVDDVTDAITGAGLTVGEDPGDDFTQDEVDAAVTKAEENVKNSSEEKERQRKVSEGEMTPEEAEEERKVQIADEAMRILIADNFSLEIPTFVMAGEIKVSGTSPKPNQDIQIMAVKKFFGFDWLASDTELATVTSDANYQYEAILNLDEFGIIEVYARIPKEWWEILDADIETPHHTVFVMTWGVILVLVVAAALIYDKSSGGKLQKMLKGKRKR